MRPAWWRTRWPRWRSLHCCGGWCEGSGRRRPGRSLLRLLRCRWRRRRVRGEWAAAAGALLFALHPVQVEAVAWASGLKDVLCGLFAVAALWQYTAFAQAEETAPARWKHYAVAALCFVAAVLSKPTGVVVPALAAVIDLL